MEYTDLRPHREAEGWSNSLPPHATRQIAAYQIAACNVQHTIAHENLHTAQAYNAIQDKMILFAQYTVTGCFALIRLGRVLGPVIPLTRPSNPKQL